MIKDYKIISLPRDVSKIHQFEKEIFQTDEFNTETAVFPKQVFKRKFSYYFFMSYNDCFFQLDDYQNFINFLDSINEESFLVSCPSFYSLNAIEFSVHCPHATFIEARTYNIPELSKHFWTGVGLLASPEIFMYSKNNTWAMVHDITHNLLIIGLDTIGQKAFKESINSKLFYITDVIKNIKDNLIPNGETYKFEKIKEDIIKLYSNKSS